MAFCREVNNDINLLGGQERAEGIRITDVELNETVIGIVSNVAKRLQIARIGELVDIDHAVLVVAGQPAAHCRPDEPCSAGDQISHSVSLRGDLSEARLGIDL